MHNVVANTRASCLDLADLAAVLNHELLERGKPGGGLPEVGRSQAGLGMLVVFSVLSSTVVPMPLLSSQMNLWLTGKGWAVGRHTYALEWNIPDTIFGNPRLPHVSGWENIPKSASDLVIAADYLGYQLMELSGLTIGINTHLLKFAASVSLCVATEVRQAILGVPVDKAVYYSFLHDVSEEIGLVLYDVDEFEEEVGV